MFVCACFWRPASRVRSLTRLSAVLVYTLCHTRILHHESGLCSQILSYVSRAIVCLPAQDAEMKLLGLLDAGDICAKQSSMAKDALKLVFCAACSQDNLSTRSKLVASLLSHLLEPR